MVGKAGISCIKGVVNIESDDEERLHEARCQTAIESATNRSNLGNQKYNQQPRYWWQQCSAAWYWSKTVSILSRILAFSLKCTILLDSPKQLSASSWKEIPPSGIMLKIMILANYARLQNSGFTLTAFVTMLNALNAEDVPFIKWINHAMCFLALYTHMFSCFVQLFAFKVHRVGK